MNKILQCPCRLSLEQYLNFKHFVNYNKHLSLHERSGYHHPPLSIRLFDCKVHTRRGSSDDTVYMKKGNVRIRNEVTRGCVLVEIDNNGEKMYKMFQGFAKFSGLTQQDDDDLAKSNNECYDGDDDVFFSKSVSCADKIVKVRKENGKAAHLAAFRVGKEVFYIAGSKNYHTVFRKKEDLPLKEMLNVVICRYMLQTLDGLSEKKRNEFIDLLCDYEVMANFELMLKEEQHVVDYKIPDDKEYLLVFLAFTGRRFLNPDYLESFEKLYPVNMSLSYAKSIGLLIPEYKEYDIDSNTQKDMLKTLINEVRLEENNEGSVFYFMHKDKTFGLSKIKTIWYIIYRAIREKVKFNSNNFNHLIKKRFFSIQKWLNLSDEEVTKWRITAYYFNVFLGKQKTHGRNKRGKRVNIVGRNYAKYLNSFLEEFDIEEHIDDDEKVNELSDLINSKQFIRKESNHKHKQTYNAKDRKKRKKKKKKKR